MAKLLRRPVGAHPPSSGQAGIESPSWARAAAVPDVRVPRAHSSGDKLLGVQMRAGPGRQSDSADDSDSQAVPGRVKE